MTSCQISNFWANKLMFAFNVQQRFRKQVLVSVKDGQIVGEDFFILAARVETLVEGELRSNRNLGRDVKAGSDLVPCFRLRICGPLSG